MAKKPIPYEITPELLRDVELFRDVDDRLHGGMRPYLQELEKESYESRMSPGDRAKSQVDRKETEQKAEVALQKLHEDHPELPELERTSKAPVDRGPSTYDKNIIRPALVDKATKVASLNTKYEDREVPWLTGERMDRVLQFLEDQQMIETLEQVEGATSERGKTESAFHIKSDGTRKTDKYYQTLDRFLDPSNDLRSIAPPDEDALEPYDPTIRERVIAENRALGQITPKEKTAISTATEIIDEVLPGEGEFIINDEDPPLESDLLSLPSTKKKSGRGRKKRRVVKLEDFKRKSTLPSKDKTSAVPKIAKSVKKSINWGLVAKFALNARLFNPVLTLIEALISSKVANKGEEAFLRRMLIELDNAPPDKRQETFDGIMGYKDHPPSKYERDEDLFAFKAPKHIKEQAEKALKDREDAPTLEAFTSVDRAPDLEEPPVTPFDDITDKKGEIVKDKTRALPAPTPDEPISFQKLSKMRKDKPPTKDYK